MGKIRTELTPYRLFGPQLVGLVTALDKNQKPDITPISLITSTEIPPPIVTIYVHPDRYAHDCIIYSKEFVVNVPSMNLAKEVAYCGTTTGKTVDKFKETGLTPTKSDKVSAPRIEECFVHVECKLVNFYLRTGLHTIFVGDVVAEHVDEDILMADRIDYEKAKPLFHLYGGNKYATIGKLETIQV